MLIDDDEPTNFISKMVLQESNCCDRVKSFIYAKKALDYLKKVEYLSEIPDLILLDINMPAMNGWEFLKAYEPHYMASVKKPIICMVTTSLNPDDAKRAGEEDLLSGFYLKPLNSGHMIDIFNYIRRKISAN